MHRPGSQSRRLSISSTNDEEEEHNERNIDEEEEHNECNIDVKSWIKEDEDFTFSDEKHAHMNCMIQIIGGRIAVGYEGYGIDIIDIETKQSIETILPGTKIRAIAQLPTGHIAVCQGENRAIQIIREHRDPIINANISDSPNSAISLCVIAGDTFLRGSASEKKLIKFSQHGDEIGATRKTEIEPRQIISLPNGKIGISHCDFGHRTAVTFVEDAVERTSCTEIKGSPTRCPFITSDYDGNIYVASVSHNGNTSITKFSSEGVKIEVIVSNHTEKVKRLDIKWWLAIAAMSGK